MKDPLAPPRRSFRRLEPTLGIEEDNYRLHTLPQDRREAQFIVVATAITLLIGHFTDSLVAGFSFASIGRLWLFGAAGTFTVAVALTLGRVARPTSFDHLIFVWVVGLAFFALYIHASGTPAYTEGATVLIALAAYTVLPVPLPYRVVPATLLTVGDVYILLRVEHAPVLALLPTLLLYGFVHVIGIWSSTAFHTIRRRQFAAQRQEHRAREEMERIASTDGLTGVLARREFLGRAEAEFERHRRYGSPLTLLITDLDFFKRVNDELGHQAGDEVLRRFAAVLEEQRRESDLVGRLGGEEFGVLLPETPRSAALEAAERLLQACRAMVVPVPGAEVRITCSIGMAEAAPADVSLTDVMRRADAALYRAKGGGRDQVRIDDA